MTLPLPLPAQAQSQTYLNTAAVGLLPKPVLDAQIHHATTLANFGEAHIPALLNIQEEARSALASLLQVKTEDIGFVASTSHGMDIFAQMGLEAGTRRRIVCPREEFPSSTLPWLGRDYALQFIPPKGGAYELTDFENAMGDDVFAIVVSAAQFADGCTTRLKPLADLAHKWGALLIANVTQAAGLTPLDLTRDGVDLAAGTGHKWLMSGFGNGYIVVPEHSRERFKIPGMGWLSVPDPMAMNNRGVLPKNETARVEYGVMSLLPRICLLESLRLIQSVGVETGYAYVKGLSQKLREGAQSRGLTLLGPKLAKNRAASVLMTVPEPEQVVEVLLAKNVTISQRGGGVRVSPHLYNTVGDIETFFRLLDEIL